MNLMNSNNIILPKELIPYFRSNHAGETGAVYIYKAIIKFSKNKDILKFSKLHLSTETKHLNLLESIIPKKDFSKLIGLWKFFGFLTGFVPSILGRNFIYTTIFYVETFVEKHYQEQINMLDNSKQSKKLKKIIEDLMNDEIDHKDDAKKKIKKLTILNKAWGHLITHGSKLAVNISKRF